MQPIADQNSSLIPFLTQKKWAWVRHGLLLLVLLANFELLNPDSMRKFAGFIGIDFRALLIGNLIGAAFSLVIIYLNLWVLFPLFFKKGRFTAYALGVFGLMVCFFLLNYGTHQVWINFYGKKDDFAAQFNLGNFFMTVMYPTVFLASTTGYKIFKTWLEDQKRFAELAQERLQAELRQLKNQVNPHFLFNTLNNLDVLIQTNPTKASQIALGLSDVLRYQIYDSQHDFVRLEKDIEIIRQYLELEQIRRDNLLVKITIIGDMTGIQIPPLLFVNFVENAIKHSHVRGGSFIEIQFQIEKNWLEFIIKNTISTNPIRSETGGFGLKNIQKRLDLLYGEAHLLRFGAEAGIFSVFLKTPI
jgi:Histidine kinase